MLLPGLTRIDLTTAYHRFSLVLLDEATSALDIATETKLLEALRALAEKLTIVMVAHRLRSLANCDKLVDLSKKRGSTASPGRITIASLPLFGFRACSKTLCSSSHHPDGED